MQIWIHFKLKADHKGLTPPKMIYLIPWKQECMYNIAYTAGQTNLRRHVTNVDYKGTGDM